MSPAAQLLLRKVAYIFYTQMELGTKLMLMLQQLVNNCLELRWAHQREQTAC